MVSAYREFQEMLAEGGVRPITRPFIVGFSVIAGIGLIPLG
ncbi:hypothetical protein QE207_04390 [Arsenophonus nasoniae]|uniref:Uncharacterized protein n=1 Tax=Arsenophonus nasoniae TaxID=638 RepID=A0AA95GBC3_9GAMM|nr:hypothetical protein [Arsenophonus nasoniae]WGL95841.1 hypothetical protein QE207_04390 [Arsenophonus nasoniae]